MILKKKKPKYLYQCEDCGTHFNFPDIKCPDCGLAFETGILGLRKNEPINFCPKCSSVNIKKLSKGEKKDEK